MCYLLLPDGSALFKLPVPEDFAWYCMFAALNRDLKLKMIKAPLSVGLFLFPVCFSSLMLCCSICSPGARLTVVFADIIFNCKALVIYLHPAAKNASYLCGSTRYKIAICTIKSRTGTVFHLRSASQLTRCTAFFYFFSRQFAQISVFPSLPLARHISTTNPTTPHFNSSFPLFKGDLQGVKFRAPAPGFVDPMSVSLGVSSNFFLTFPFFWFKMIAETKR